MGHRRASASDGSIRAFLFLWLLMALVVTVLEAVFLISKNYYFVSADTSARVLVLLNSIGMLLIPGGLLALIMRLMRPLSPGPPLIERALGFLGLFAFFSISLCVALLHMDTWIYGSFRSSVVNLELWARLCLLLLMLFCAVWLVRARGRGLVSWARRYQALAIPAYSVFISIVCVSGISYFLQLGSAMKEMDSYAAYRGAGLPDILVFSSDGIDNSGLSLYGYERKTTNYLDSFARESILYNNAYTNCSHSRCSDSSFLSGKHPLGTKVMFDPDILLGLDSFRHLPGILARMGYYNVYMGDGYQSLPSAYNMRMAFHEENGVPTGLSPYETSAGVADLYSLETYLISRMVKRYRDLLLYMSGFSWNYANHRAFGLAFEEEQYASDEESFLRLRDMISSDNAPVFAFLHLAGTHGPRFPTQMVKYSKGKEQTEDWDADFYDDAVLSQDYLFGLTMGELVTSGRIKNTIVIFKTDHGKRSENEVPVPLIVRLPHGPGGIRVDSNVQYLDIGPSILDVLGAPVPGWMEGGVIFPALKTEEKGPRPIASISTALVRDEVDNKPVSSFSGPPYYGVDSLFLVEGQYRFRFSLHQDSAVLFKREGEDVERVLGDVPTFMRFLKATTTLLKDNGFSDIPALR